MSRLMRRRKARSSATPAGPGVPPVGGAVPVQTLAIAPRSFEQGSGTQTYDVSPHFTGATSYSLVSAPAGVTVNSSTGVISVVTTSVIDSTFTVRATNGAGNTDVPAFLMVLKTGAGTYYVAPTGSDAAAGTIGAPWATLAYARTQATAAGDRIVMRGGVYNHSAGITVNAAVSSSSPRLITAYSGEVPILDFSGCAPNVDAIYTGSNNTWAFIHIRNATRAGINSYAETNIRMVGCEVYNCFRNGIYHGAGTLLAAGHIVEWCKIHDNVQENSARNWSGGWATGLTFSRLSGCIGRYNWVFNNYGEGIILGALQSSHFLNNWVYDNFSVQLYLDNVQGTASVPVQLENNYLFQTGNTAFWRDRSAPYDTFVVGDGLLFGNEAATTPQYQINYVNARYNTIVGFPLPEPDYFFESGATYTALGSNNNLTPNTVNTTQGAHGPAWLAPAGTSGTARTATFGQGTPAGAAGYRPYLSSGAADPLVSYDSLVSGSLGSYTPAISSRRLVFSGSTGAPNGAVLRCTGTSGAVYDVTVSSPANCRAVKDQTEFDALTSSVYSTANSKLVIREGASIDWNHYTSGWTKRVNLNGLVIEGDGPDPRLTWQDPAQDGRRHFRYVETDVLNNVVVQNCLIATNVGLPGDAKRNAFWSRSSAGGGVDTDHIALRRNAIIVSRPNPLGNYSALGSFPGSAGIATNLAKGIEVRDCVIHGATYAVAPYVSTWQLVVGNWIDCWYNDGIQSASIRTPLHVCANYFTRPCGLATDAEGPHTDCIQDEGDSNTGAGVHTSVFEGNWYHRGNARGFVEMAFIDDATGSPRFTALLRGNGSTESQSPGNMFLVTSSSGSIMEDQTWMPLVGTPSPAGGGRAIMGIGSGFAEGTNHFRNNLCNTSALQNAGGVTSAGNLDLGALSEAARDAAFTDRTFGGAALPTMKQVIDGARGIGIAAGKGSRMQLADGAERSAYTYAGLSAPVFSDVSVTRVSDTAATLSLKSSVECNPIYWAAIPAATATPTDIEDLRRRRIAGAHSYGVMKVPAGQAATAKTAAVTVPAAGSYKVLFFQENGPTRPSAVQAQSFATTP